MFHKELIKTFTCIPSKEERSYYNKKFLTQKEC